MRSLKDLYKNHSGKVSDKWSIYLNEYEDKLRKYQELPIKFFEIGILNGGSLEIFSKYFTKAELILGCDIDAKCNELHYDQMNIKVIDLKSDLFDKVAHPKELYHFGIPGHPSEYGYELTAKYFNKVLRFD